MTSSYKHNGDTFLVYHVVDEETLDKVNKFTGDHYRTYAKMNQTILLTLRGWMTLDIGDYVVHLFASEERPKTLNLGVEETFLSNGFLVVPPAIFEKHFTPITLDVR